VASSTPAAGSVSKRYQATRSGSSGSPVSLLGPAGAPVLDESTPLESATVEAGVDVEVEASESCSSGVAEGTAGGWGVFAPAPPHSPSAKQRNDDRGAQHAAVAATTTHARSSGRIRPRSYRVSVDLGRCGRSARRAICGLVRANRAAHRLAARAVHRGAPAH